MHRALGADCAGVLDVTVFIPDIGFRPGRGLALPKPVTVVTADGRGLMVMRLASTAYGTDLAFEIRDPVREGACKTGRPDYPRGGGAAAPSLRGAGGRHPTPT